MKKLIFIYLLLFLLIINKGFPDSNYFTYLVYKDINLINIESYTDIPIIGIESESNMGIIGRVRIAIVNEEKNKVVFDDRTKIDETTMKAVLDAIEFAETYSNNKRNYFISYDMHTDSLSGGSSGSSIALGLTALLLNKQLKKDWIITGAIDNEGNVIVTGGIPMKIVTAGSLGFKKMLIPYSQSKILINKNDNIPDLSNKILLTEIDLKKFAKDRYDLEIREVKNIKEILSDVIV